MQFVIYMRKFVVDFVFIPQGNRFLRMISLWEVCRYNRLRSASFLTKQINEKLTCLENNRIWVKNSRVEL